MASRPVLQRGAGERGQKTGRPGKDWTGGNPKHQTISQDLKALYQISECDTK